MLDGSFGGHLWTHLHRLGPLTHGGTNGDTLIRDDWVFDTLAVPGRPGTYKPLVLSCTTLTLEPVSVKVKRLSFRRNIEPSQCKTCLKLVTHVKITSFESISLNKPFVNSERLR